VDLSILNNRAYLSEAYYPNVRVSTYLFGDYVFIANGYGEIKVIIKIAHLQIPFYF